MNLEFSSPVLEGNGDINLGKCERIKACIDSFLEKNPRMTLQTVEDKTGVPISTLRRIVNLKGNPQPETVIKVFIALGVISHNTDTTLFSHKRHQSLQSSFSLAFPVCHS